MLSSKNQNNLQKNLLFLAVGVGVGITAMYAGRKLTTKSKGAKKSAKQPAETPKSKAQNKYLDVELGTDYFNKEQQFEQSKQVNLANALLKNGTQKPIKGKKGLDKVNQYLEEAEIKLCKINKIQQLYPNTQMFVNPLLPDDDVPESMKSKIQKFDESQYQYKIPAKCFLDDRTFIIQEKYFKDIVEMSACFKFMRAGPRKEVVYKREEAKAAIVTCGGLCPGLNVVIKSIVDCLSYEYGVEEIWGIKWGYRGFYEKPEYWTRLTSDNVNGIQNLGGTILGSSRGGFDGDKMIKALKEKGINQLYCIGGDGTHRGINNLIGQVREQNYKLSVCGIPKTIDNDIPLIDRSFGFRTSVQESIKSINSALTEAKSAEYGVGIVRLMGRYCGFISVFATLAARDVNVCLIPEVYFQLYGPDGVYEHIIKIATTKGHCVVVVAEGAEEGLVDEDREEVRNELGIKEDRIDESGNRKNLDLAKFMVKDLGKYAKKTKNIALTIKYLNPTYAIRTTPANGYDAELCHRLAHTGVHSIQAGFTDFSVGNVRDQPVLIPISLLISQSSRQLKRKDHEYQRVIESNQQPNFLNKENMVEYLQREKDRDIKRRELYLKSKCEQLGACYDSDEKALNRIIGASGQQNY